MKSGVVLAILCVLAGSALAQDPTSMEVWRAPLHTKPLHEMTTEELRAYKAAVEARARELGLFDKKGPSYRPLPPDQRRTVRPTPRKVAGTSIQYDSGTVTGGAGTASQMLGNRFDSAQNGQGTACCFPVETSGTITMITFDMVNTFFGSVVFSLYSDIVGTMAVQVTSMARPGIMTGLNTLAVMSPTSMNSYQNGTFLAGIWQFDPTMTGLGVDTGTTNGQGFHAISLNDGAAGTGLTTLMSLNAVFRVQGNVATPVELQEFKIEDDE